MASTHERSDVLREQIARSIKRATDLIAEASLAFTLDATLAVPISGRLSIEARGASGLAFILSQARLLTPTSDSAGGQPRHLFGPVT